MEILKYIKKIFGYEEEKPVIKVKRDKTNDTRTVLEKVLSSGNEQLITSYYNHQAYKKGTTDEHFKLNVEKYNKPTTNIINFEFVPKQQANKNCRTYLEYKEGSYKRWQEIRYFAEKRNSKKCKICKKSSKLAGKSYHTECHEVWEYNYNKERIQKLVKLEALCVFCHNIKHLDQHENNEEYFNALLKRYAEINKINIKKAKEEYKKAVEYRDEKTEKYILDMGLLTIYGASEDCRKFDPHQKEFLDFLQERKNKENEEKEKKDGE